MLGDIIILILAALNLFAMIYIPVYVRCEIKQQKEAGYDKLMCMIENYCTEPGQASSDRCSK